MGRKTYTPGPGEEVEFRLPNGLTVVVWAGVLEESDLLNIRSDDSIVVQPVMSNRIIIRKR